MKVGIGLAYTDTTTTAEGAQALAEACEATGVESVWAAEHVVVPEGYGSPYPYTEDQKMPGGETVPVPDPLLWLTKMAAHTDTVRVITGVLILPQRNPVILAKEAATLDVLSQGRAELGIGVGWLAEEYAAVGVPFEDRGARADEYMEILRALWSDEETYAGRYYSFERARMHPKPIQASIPIHVGGHSKAAARRAGRLGDGFFAAAFDGLDELIGELREAAAAHGRDPDAVELTASAARDPETMRQLVDLGVSRVVVNAPVFETPEEVEPKLRRRLERVQENVAAVV